MAMSISEGQNNRSCLYLEGEKHDPYPWHIHSDHYSERAPTRGKKLVKFALQDFMWLRLLV